ncbi:MAG: MFS transporter, partial [Gammaproteobacteria bacterium]|nr:MFS transporter [Gammaproteobacteria bacterium]
AVPPAPPVAAVPRASAAPARLFDPRHRNRTIMMSVFNAAQVVAFYGFNAWLPSLLIARGITVTHSLEYSFLIAVSQPFGPALGIAFADRCERRTQILAALVAMGGAMWLFARLSNPAALIAVGIVFTLSANVMSYAYHNYQAELFPTEIRARAIGFVYSWSRLAAAFGGLAIGYLLRTGGTAAVAAFVAGAITIAFVAVGAFGPRTKDLGLEAIDRGQ